MPLSKKYKLEE